MQNPRDMAHAAHEAAAEELRRLSDELATARAAHEAAVIAHDSDPSTTNGKDVLRTRDAAELLKLRVDGATKREATARGQLEAAEAALVAAERAQEVERLTKIGSVPALAAALAPAIAKRREAEQLLVDAAKIEAEAAARVDAARVGAGLPRLPFTNTEQSGARALATAIVSVELGRADWRRAVAVLGLTLPEEMAPTEWWGRLMAGETHAAICADATARRHARTAKSYAAATDAATDPIVRARCAVDELLFEREHGVWASEEREAGIPRIVAAALPVAREAAEKNRGFYVYNDHGREARIGWDQSAAPDARVIALLHLDRAGLTLAQLEQLEPLVTLAPAAMNEAA